MFNSKRKKFSFVTMTISLILLVFLMVGCGSKPDSNSPEQQKSVQEKEVVLRLVSAWTKDTNGSEFLPKLIEEVNKKGAGVVKIELVGGPEVAKEVEQMDLVSKGAFDMAFTTPNYYGGMVPGAVSIHTTNATTKELRDSGIWDVYDQMHQAKAGVNVLGTLWRGENFVISSNKPIPSTDWKGLRIKGFVLYEDLIKQMGGSSMFIPLGDLYPSLSKGVVDATINPITLLEDYSINKAAPNIMGPFLPAVTSGHVVINSKVWQSLSKRAKDIIMGVMLEIESEVDPFYKAKVDKALQDLLSKGGRLVELPPDQAKKLTEAANTLPWNFINKNDPEWGPKLEEKVKKLLAK